MKKRISAGLLVAAILIGLLLIGAQAASEIIFVSVGDQFLTPSAGTMPMRRGGQLYVPYTIFTKSLGVYSSYNKNEKLLVLFNLDYTMTFDLNTGETEDENGERYQNPAVFHNGTVYVCVADVASKMGIYYSQLVDAAGTVIRLNKDRPALSDSLFISLGRSVMEGMTREYNTSEEQAQPEEPETPSEEKKPRLYLTFDASPGESTGAVLDALGKAGVKAAFFLTGERLTMYDDAVRRMTGEGHAVGLCGMSGSLSHLTASLDSFSAEWEDANRMLDRVTMGRTRLICLPGRARGKTLTAEQAAVLSANGLRLWGYDAQISGDTAEKVLASAKNAAQKAKNNAVLRFSDNAATAAALPQILSYLKKNGYSFGEVGEWVSPEGS